MTPHFLDCTCQCEYKRLLLQARLTNYNQISVSKRSFLLIDVGGQRLKPSHDIIQYDEYQCIGVPTNAWVMERLQGNIGDLFIDKTPGNHALYAKISATEWKKWPGPLSITNVLRHPLYPNYVLWCHPSTMTISWFFDLLINRVYSDGSAHDIIHAILEERREGEAKQPRKRKIYPSEGQEVAFQKKSKASHNDSQPVTTTRPTPQTSSFDPIYGPLRTIARLNQEAIRLQSDHAALQKLVTMTHPTLSLGSNRSPRSVSNLLDSPRKSPHSSAIPIGKVTMSKSCLDRSPKPLESGVPFGSSHQCTPDEGDRKLRNGNSEFADTVLATLDPEKEANVNTSSVYTTDAIDHNTLNEPVMADVTRHNSLPAGQGTHIDIDLPSSGADFVTLDEPDDHRDIDASNVFGSVARPRISPVSIPSEPLDQEASVDNQVGGIPVEGASHVTTGTFCLDLHSDDTPTTVVTSDSDKNSPLTCNQHFPPQTDLPSMTAPDPISETTLSVEQHFKLNCSLKEIIFHVLGNSTLICRLCLGTQASAESLLHTFSMDASLEDLGDHCVKEHPQFCEVLRKMSAKEVDSLKQHFSH